MMKPAVYKIAGLLISITVCSMFWKAYLIPLLYQPKVYNISAPEINSLEQTITSDETWQQFLAWFPHSALPFTMPAYYHEGISKALFLVERDLQNTSPYSMSVWLYAYVQTSEHGITFQCCRLRVDYLDEHNLIASYLLNEQETHDAFTSDTRESFVSHLLSTVYPQ